jgi:hypothetical protein
MEQKQQKQWIEQKQWRWSNGIPYEKSSIIKKVEDKVMEMETKNNISEEEEPYSVCYNPALSKCNETMYSRNEIVNRREETYNKMALRIMSNQINQNPFLLNCDYVNDLSTQDKYMKPINTTFEKVKTGTNNN